jgi:hypothetical protein
MDMIQSLTGKSGAAAGTDQAKVAGGFIEALTQHPAGIQGVLDAFKNNGMAEHVNSWTTGQAATATPEQVQHGLGGTGLIEKTAEKSRSLPSSRPDSARHRPADGHPSLRAERPGYPDQLHGQHGKEAPQQIRIGPVFSGPNLWPNRHKGPGITTEPARQKKSAKLTKGEVCHGRSKRIETEIRPSH